MQNAEAGSSALYRVLKRGTKGFQVLRFWSLTSCSCERGANDNVTPRSRAAVSALRKKRPRTSAGPCSTSISEMRAGTGRGCRDSTMRALGLELGMLRLTGSKLMACPQTAMRYKLERRFSIYKSLHMRRTESGGAGVR